MNIKASEFAFYLKNSSLNSQEQRTVLDLLPRLSDSQTQELFERLKKDHLELKEVLNKVHMDREAIQFNFYTQLREV